MEVEIWVHCDQHGRPHRLNEDCVSCWCGCIEDLPDLGMHGTLLEALNEEEAYKECRARKLWLYNDFMKKKVRLGNIQMPTVKPPKKRENEISDEESLNWWIKKWKAEVYRNTKPSANRSCDLNCGHEWVVVIPHPAQELNPEPEKDCIIGCGDTIMDAASAISRMLFCSKNFDIIFCSDGVDYRKTIGRHKCDGIYCGNREQYEYMEREFGENEPR